MSSAPLPSLRSLWANGGAPGAFVRRDQSLTRHLESLLHAADGAQTMGDADGFASLVQDFSWDEALPDSAAHDVTEGEREAPAWRVRGAAPATPTRDAGSHRGPAPADLAALRRGEPAHADPSRRVSAHTHPTPADLRAHTTSHAPSADPPRDDHGDVAGLVAARAADPASAHAPPATAAELRRVAPLSARHDAAQNARIVALLDASAPPATRAMSTSAHTDPASARIAHPATTVNQTRTPTSQLADAVRRVELVRAANRRDTYPAPAAAGALASRPARSVRFDDALPQPQRPAAPSFTDELSTPSAPAVGMRGLVERASSNRAEFFFADTQFEATPHADADFDAFSSLLDDAARRDGIDLEEALS